MGRPWGQFQGESRSARWLTIWRMAGRSRDLPIMMEERQALMASIARTLKVEIPGFRITFCAVADYLKN